ncbi:zinc finger MYM-type protein 4 [Planococcus citri]|uniref:zinc finger MYM-type protein 4 n=1 Tax=Planococcus citri TaxID=170843 RepID=UPI0031F7EB8C
MRMENSSIEKEVNSVENTEDADRVNHIPSKNENASSNAVAEDVSSNDIDVGPTLDGLTQKETRKNEGDVVNLKPIKSSGNNSIEINGDLNEKSDENLSESNSLPNDKIIEVNEEIGAVCSDSSKESLDANEDKNDTSASSNGKSSNREKEKDDTPSIPSTNENGSEVDSSQLDDLSSRNKNITNSSCDSEDYLSATDSNEISTPAKQSKSGDGSQISIADEVTSDEVDSSVARDDSANFNSFSKSVPSVENHEKSENSTNSLEPMEVDRSPSPASITESNEKDDSNFESAAKSPEQKDTVEETSENPKSMNKDNQQADSNVDKTNENSDLINEDHDPSKSEDQSSSTAEKLDDDQITDNSLQDTSANVDSTKESPGADASANVDSTKETSGTDVTSVNTSNSTISKTVSETVNNKESTSEETSDAKNTEVLHIDENDEEPEEVMDTSECDPFGQVSENAATEVEEMEVDGTSSCKDAQSEMVEIVTVINSTEEYSSSSESASKSTHEKSSTDDSVDQTDENCIIPDNVNNEGDEGAKTTIEVVKPKFDITPVRLEKLMDPSKFVNSQEKSNELIQDKSSSTTNDPDSNNLTVTSRPQRQAAKKAESQIKEIVAQTESESYNIEDIEKLAEPSLQVCYRCSRLRQCRFVASLGSRTVYLCQESCFESASEKKGITLKCTSKLQPAAPQKAPSVPDSIHFLRKCSQCNLHNILDDKSLTWEAMDFCNEDCLSRYQVQHGANCAFCKGSVQHMSMGKYSVRFGLEARQFCSGTCLEEFKKGLKSCSYCQQDITKATDIITAQIGDKGQTKDFCLQSCVEKYERMSTNSPLPVIRDTCTVCAQLKDVEVQVFIQSRTHPLCSDVCFMTFKFANNISDVDQCHICKKFYEEGNPDSYFVFHDDTPYNFCSKVCMNVFILFRRKIVPCNWCKVKKYNFDMIKRCSSGGSSVMMCSLNCLTLYQVSMNATSTRKIKCDLCSSINYAQYHLTMSDATIRNFCSYNCVMIFQTQYNKTPLTMHEPNKSNSAPVPLGAPKRAILHQKTVVTPTNDLQRNSIQKSITTVANGLLPQLTSTGTLKISSPLTVATASGPSTLLTTTSTAKTQTVTKYIQQIIIKPPEPKETTNKFTQCNINTANKSVSCQPEVSTQETQTDEISKYPAIVPIPVPIYVPAPMHMFTTPFPVPVPFALPIPVPIFIPTTKSTYKGVVQYIKEIVDKTPANPFEADLLLMAKMVAGEEKPEESEEVTKNDSGEDDEMPFVDATQDGESFAESESSTSNNFGDDVLQMAMKMATEQLSNSPTVDLEAELTSNTITPQTQTEDNNAKTEVVDVPVEPRMTRTRKRASKAASETPTRKRGRQQTTAPTENDSQSSTALSQSPDVSSASVVPESERPDVNMCLKFTIGIRAWKQWLLAKNEQLEQAATAANKKAKTFNLNILKLTTDELNYLLCLFVKEVRKPNGDEYAPDTIYYLCLSIQQYLFENGRIDNIFTDTFYEPFTNALDEVAKKFSEINDATQYIVTRVEEEHLWESKQLGAHSPHVLLATLMFFNTKYFNLATLEEHMQLSFSHIMKHWKRNPNTPVGKPGSPAANRNVVLRFYPPQAALDAPNSRKKKVYEQHENEVNPLRCPVKLYEFYLSKCPESVKQRNDVFYLQPERSCVPDSPVWYSTMPLQKDLLMKMLHRVRMVKEVNVSLLAS